MIATAEPNMPDIKMASGYPSRIVYYKAHEDNSPFTPTPRATIQIVVQKDEAVLMDLDNGDELGQLTSASNFTGAIKVSN
jgi:hypothetical protein